MSLPPPLRRLDPSQSTVCDGLRYLAALLVLAHHLVYWSYKDVYKALQADHLTSLSGWGVGLFFVLSGFLISTSALAKQAREPGFGLGRYLLERFTRIYLGFLPATLLVGGLALLGPWLTKGLYQPKTLSLASLLKTLLLVANVSGFGPVFDLMAVSWTLTYEMALYILFGLVALPGRWGFAGATARLAGALVLLFFLARTDNWLYLFYHWFCGLAVGALFQAGPVLKSRAGTLAALAALAGSFFLVFRLAGSALPVGGFNLGPYLKVTYMAAGFYGLLLLAGLMDLGRRFGRACRFLASFSYSLYLIHYAVGWLTLVALDRWGLVNLSGGRKLAGVLAVALLCQAAAWLFSQGTERWTPQVRALLARRLGLEPAAPGERG